ncbi:NAD(P)H-dependent oxidoreductase [Campylobacter sp. RM16187]|uniref:NAD(P)H-dependent oxidoreductase n=1 Tax=Campylobacter sp. RM16187 TaxID=1660063 RepID=UPI0021B6797A|nr:NAD(P)H-dependent oxidoreductase [Campylobacter sp. RM16187]QKG30130.1 flavodoxin-like fold domain protein, putative NAD(P)H (quinone) dehydrogenase/reductase [Campylobacter sp. RM16187]
MKSVVIMSHPYYKNSRINKALFEVAKGINNVETRHLEELYGYDTSKIDVGVEQKILESADRIVFQFPMFWLNVPAMLKAYIDEVFTYGWAYGSTGDKLKNKDFYVAVSLGSSESEYSKEGKIKFSLDEILLPLKITAGYCGMNFKDIFVSGGVYRMNDDDIANCSQRYIELFKDKQI